MASHEQKNNPSAASKQEGFSTTSNSIQGDTIILEVVENAQSTQNNFSQFQSSATQSIFSTAKHIPVTAATLKFVSNQKESTSGVMTGYLC